MQPEKLAGKLMSLAEKLRENPGPKVLVFGDCCSLMDKIESHLGATRPPVHNCVQMLVTDERFQEFRKRGAFVLLPGWAGRWRVLLRTALGPDPHWAREMMQECHREIIYLDTMQMPLPQKQLNACALFFGLPWYREPVDLEVMQQRLQEAAKRSLAGLQGPGS
jgi:hypothetical protein